MGLMIHFALLREPMATHFWIKGGGAWQAQGTTVGYALIKEIAKKEIPITNLRVSQPDNSVSNWTENKTTAS